MKPCSHRRTLKKPNLVNLFHVQDTVVMRASGQPNQKQVSANCYGQDRANNTYLLGKSEDGVNWDMVKGAPPLDTPGLFTDSSKWRGTLRFASGKTRKQSFKVVGKENITTPAGRFASYKVAITFVESDGRTASAYNWGVPQIGFPVKAQVEERRQGQQAVIRMKLTLKTLKLDRSRR